MPFLSVTSHMSFASVGHKYCELAKNIRWKEQSLMYFRVMLIGFFEGIESERGIVWRVADRLR